MKAITLTQPWATLVAIGAKQLETRSWQTKYRGPLAIHAGQGLGPVGGKIGLMGVVANEPFLTVLQAWHPNTVVRPDYWLPRAAIIATCSLVDCCMIGVLDDGTPTYMAFDEFPPVLTAVQEPERSFGDYRAGRYAWILANIRALSEPIPCKGALSLWEPDTLTQLAIKRQQIQAVPA